MSNIAQLTSIRGLSAYLPDGVWGSIRALTENLPMDVRTSDGLTLYTFAGLSTTKQEVSDTAGARPLLIIAESKGTLCWIHVYDADADDVTVGVDVDFVVPVSGTSGEVTVLTCFGAGWKTFWNTGLTVSASTATETSAAPTNTPNLYMLYA